MNLSFRRRPAILVSTVVTAALAAVIGAAPTASAAGQSDLVDQYSSLSGALLGFYAEQSQTSLADYLTKQQVALAPSTVGDPVAEHLAQATQTPATTGTPSATAGEGGYSDLSSDTAPTPSPTAPTAPTLPAPSTPTVASLSGGVLSLPQAASLGVQAKAVNAKTVTDLNKQLSAAGLTLNTSGYKSLDALAAKVAANAATPDGAVTIAGAKWVAQLSSLHTPSVGTPKAGTPATPGVPKGALPYGLLLNKSLTTLITDSPDLVADAKKSGLGSQKLATAWNSSMLKAYNNSKADFSNVLPDKCAGVMLQVMASGNAASSAKAGGGCAPACLTGGMYLNNQAKGLFDPSMSSIVPNPTAPVWSESTYGAFQGWAKGLAVAQNPGLAGSLTNQLKGANTTANCSAAASASKSSLSKTLPGVFSSLR